MSELRLSRSTATGPPLRVAIDRTALGRALALGCRTLRIDPEGKVVAAEGPQRTFLAATLDASFVVLSDKKTNRTTTDSAPADDRARPHPDPERKEAMKPHEQNGRTSNGRPEPTPIESPDLLAEAEALRGVLADAVARAARLVTALKNARKEKKVLSTVWAGLKQLNLGP